MRVDRHNYEEYFLLYVDNELTVDQKKQVDLFVKENPDLEEELIMLQQSRLIPETIVFNEKHLLMKEENKSSINLNNYEEWLVLYVDNELSPEQRTTVEKFVTEHPHAQTELKLFQQTKLPPDQIPFRYKNLLYRNKERVRVITMAWWRVAVAAILIIIGGLTLYSVLNKKNENGPEERIVIKKQDPVKSISPVQQQPNENNQSIKIKDGQTAVAAPIEKLKQKENRQPLVDTSSLSNKQIAKVNDNIPQRRPVIVNEIHTVQPGNLQLNNAVVTGKHKQIINDTLVTKQLSETPDDYASNTENKKLRGLFRKATRFIERTSGINPANDDNRVLIGGMAINLK